MSRLDATLAHLAPGVTACRDLEGSYNPRRGLAIYCLPVPDYSPSSPGVVLGEALAARSGLGCTLLEGIPAKIPEGAAVIGLYNALKAVRPDLLEEIPELLEPGQYALKLNRSALVTSLTPEGLAAGMQTLSMLVLRHNDDLLPAAVITDTPNCRVRCLAVEVDAAEISITLLMQIVSFAATFKANAIQLILGDDFDPNREIPGVETFIQTCQSFGMKVGVRLSLLADVLTGKKTLIETWSRARTVARAFSAERLILDDHMPVEVVDGMCHRLVDSIIKGEVGLKYVSLDATVLARSGIPPAELKPAGISGWYRMWVSDAPPSPEWDGIPMAIDVQAPLPGFTARSIGDFHKRLDAAGKKLLARGHGEMVVSFRGIGVSHMWQNMLYPAATGMIAAWGEPGDAVEAAERYSGLLYGDSAKAVMNMWDAVTAAFPSGLKEEEERLVRRVAFGHWPEDESEWKLLSRLDWPKVTRSIRTGADVLKAAAADLSRNALTLSGARLALYALSWLHCFVALTPELERRRSSKYDDDGRTEPIATELYNNFLAWHSHLQEMHTESGLEFSELERVESMGLRLKGLCEGIFE